ncbi:MAG: hypothetical protein AMJ60_05020 [Desulfobacterales bacterium SG8_35]|nr:MAG: hypothetical protein AMJ60_05020 [Desulfobacterales bacterium SG8_35]
MFEGHKISLSPCFNGADSSCNKSAAKRAVFCYAAGLMRASACRVPESVKRSSSCTPLKRVDKFFLLGHNFKFQLSGFFRDKTNLFAVEGDMTPDEMREKAINLFKKRFH